MSGGIGLYGGSFDPIHHGHLIAARAVAEQLGLERMIFIPAPSPPHKTGRRLSEATHRLAMARLAVAGEAGFEASDLEIARGGLSYTVLTVEAFRREVGPATPLYWLIGTDSLGELHTWYQVERLIELCRVVTAARPGFEDPDLAPLEARIGPEQVAVLRQGVLTTPMIDISATDVRRRVAGGRSIRYLVPPSVEAYIREHGLYTGVEEQAGPGLCGVH